MRSVQRIIKSLGMTFFSLKVAGKTHGGFWPVHEECNVVHYPCFDGLVSGVLAWEFLEEHKNWNVGEIHPVNYTIRDTWLASELRTPCAIVDFLYHPSAEFWADHHQTSMLSRAAEEDFQRRKGKACLMFDERARSCASPLFRGLGGFLTDKPHFKEMVGWAEKIDSATLPFGKRSDPR